MYYRWVPYTVRISGLLMSIFQLVCAVMVFAIAGATRGQAQTLPMPEYQQKAAFLFNFAQFVTWPAQESSHAPLVIGILGDDPFGSYLDETVRGQKVNNRALAIQRFRRSTELRNCNILFISQSERYRAAEIVSSLKGRSILTVSDMDGFADSGGMIQFLTEQNKIRVRINLNAVKAANLKVSSKLLSVAEVAH
jgi:YfiR/HmsC-like